MGGGQKLLVLFRKNSVQRENRGCGGLTVCVCVLGGGYLKNGMDGDKGGG